MDKEVIAETVKNLKEGKTILYPTDTIWGLGCDARNDTAIERVFDIKQREVGKSLVLLVSNDAMLNKTVVDVPEIAWDLLDTATSPLTIVYPQGKNVSSKVCAEDGSVAVRMIKDGELNRIINNLGRPLVSTSANISGENSPTSENNISNEIISKVDYMVNLPDRGTKKPSSIIKLGLKGEIEIIRE